MKRVAFKTLGCRLNQAETATMRAGFEEKGYRVVSFGKPAEVCVIHTCTITAAAAAECARLARRAKRSIPDGIVVLAGCAAEVDGDRLRATTGADLVIGQADKYRIPDLISSISHHPSPITHQPSPIPHHPSPINHQPSPISHHPSPINHQPSTISHQPSPIPHSAFPVPHFTTTRAWVKAQDGCSFRCAYCIVPRARGASRSRPIEEIIDEVKALAGAGHREVVLTGANLGTYRDGRLGLIELLQRVEAIDAIRRIRISSIELSTTETAVIEFMADSPKLCNFLHLPLQTGDDRLLNAMDRRYTVADYRTVVDAAVTRMPLAGIGTDLLTGLPGEDDAAFENTLNLVEALPFSNLHVFPYSPRPGTRAAAMPHQVPTEVARERAQHLIALGRRKRAAFATRFIGRPVELLVEHVDAHGTASGWTGEYLRAHVGSAAGVEANEILHVVPHAESEGVLLATTERASVPGRREPA